MVIRDVVTRWNYTHAMIQRGVLLQKAINQWVITANDGAFQGLFLTPNEWDTLKHLEQLLSVCITLSEVRIHPDLMPAPADLYLSHKTDIMRRDSNPTNGPTSICVHEAESDKGDV